jgi:hypothetical protein
MRPRAVLSSPSFAATFGASYLPGLQAALHAVQDADTVLLGVRALPRDQGAISTAMRHHRAASLGLQRFLKPGGGR